MFDLVGNERHTFDWACKQTTIALSNMLTMAAMIGVDSCQSRGFNREAVDKILEEGIFLTAKASTTTLAFPATS